MGSENNLLIIDDDKAFIEELRSLAAAKGFTVVQTADADYALTVASKEKPLMIVLNADIPRGFSVCRKIKKDGQLKEIPLALTTIKASEETINRHKTLDTRADFYFRKPFNIMDLLTVLSKVNGTAEVPDNHSSRDLQTEIDGLVNERNKLQSRIAMLEPLEQQVHTYQETVQTLEKTNAQLKERITQLEQELLTQKKREDAYIEQIESLKAEASMVEPLNRRLESMTGLFEKLELGYKNRIAGLSKDNEDLSTRVMDLERKVASLTELNSQLESRVKGYDDLRARAMEADSLQDEIRQLRAEIEELRAYKEKMEPLQEKLNRVQAMDAELSVTQKERDELISAISDMEPRMKKAQSELRQVTTQYQLLQAKLEKIRGVVCQED